MTWLAGVLRRLVPGRRGQRPDVCPVVPSLAAAVFSALANPVASGVVPAPRSVHLASAPVYVRVSTLGDLQAWSAALGLGRPRRGSRLVRTGNVRVEARGTIAGVDLVVVTSVRADVTVATVDRRC